MAGLLYIIGLVICSMVVGSLRGEVYGWGLLGGGLIVASLVVFIDSTLSGR